MSAEFVAAVFVISLIMFGIVYIALLCDGHAIDSVGIPVLIIIFISGLGLFWVWSASNKAEYKSAIQCSVKTINDVDWVFYADSNGEQNACNLNKMFGRDFSEDDHVTVFMRNKGPYHGLTFNETSILAVDGKTADGSKVPRIKNK